MWSIWLSTPDCFLLLNLCHLQISISKLYKEFQLNFLRIKMNWDLTILWTSFVEFNFLSFWVDLNFKIWSCFKNIKAMSRFQFFFVRIHTDLELLFFDWKIVILFWFLNIAQLFLDTSFDSYFFLSFCSHLVQGTRHLNFSETLALSHSASYSIVLQVKAYVYN